MAELYLVRHAQASFEADNYDHLSPLGFQQSSWLGEYFAGRDIHFDRHLRGDMLRHSQTLENISACLNPADQVVELPQLNEYDFKQLVAVYLEHNPNDAIYSQLQQSDGKDKKLYYKLLRVVLSAWSRNEMEGAAESWQQFSDRVADALLTIQETADSYQRILAIGSGGSISTFIGHVLGLPTEKVFDLNLQVRNTSISHFFFTRHKISLASFNAVPHLDSVERAQHITYG